MDFKGFRPFVESTDFESHSIYIDSSAWNRISDDHSQDRIRREFEAIEKIVNLIRRKQINLIFSQALQDEMKRYPDIAYHGEKLAKTFIRNTSKILKRAENLHEKGLGEYDAFHVAIAEEAGADALLTTDDRMIKKARSLGVSVRLENPVEWLKKTGFPN